MSLFVLNVNKMYFYRKKYSNHFLNMKKVNMFAPLINHPNVCLLFVSQKLINLKPYLQRLKILLLMQEHNVHHGSQNPTTTSESESSLAAVIAVVSLIILLVCVFR